MRFPCTGSSLINELNVPYNHYVYICYQILCVGRPNIVHMWVTKLIADHHLNSAWYHSSQVSHTVTERQYFIYFMKDYSDICVVICYNVSIFHALFAYILQS